MFDKIIEDAREERDVLLREVARIGQEVGRLRHERAGLLLENNLNGNDLGVMRINESLHNARRVLSAFNRRRECLDFMLDYIENARDNNND